jgi:hypothetical protein
MWAASGTAPIPMVEYQPGIHNQTEIIAIEASINQKHTTMMDKPSKPCKVYESNEEGINICSKNFFAKFLKDKISCTVPGKTVLLLNKTNKCI